MISTRARRAIEWAQRSTIADIETRASELLCAVALDGQPLTRQDALRLRRIAHQLILLAKDSGA